ncbi:MAG: molybdopterin-dependent oxidoreductase [Chloroflexota bacterium]
MLRSRRLDALSGLLAFAVAASLSEFVAAALSVTSPYVAVGDGVIRLAPAAAVHFATGTFGTNDKPILLATLVVITLVFGALVGALSRQRTSVPMYGFALWGIVCAIAIWVEQVQDTTAVSVVGGAAVGGWIVLHVLFETIPVEAPVGDASDDTTPAIGDPRRRTPDRRKFFAFATASAGASVAAALGARRLMGRDVDVEAERRALTLPSARQPLPMIPAAAALEVKGISPLVTPNEEFYRIDTALSVPRVNVATWRLRITGMVEHPQEFTYDELRAMAAQEADVTLTCVSNEVGDELVGNARWLGIPLPALLALAGVKAGATQIVGRSVDGFTVGFPTEAALDGRAAMVALGMNGEVLPARHGFPARLVVPGLYGYVSATKWLSEIQLTTLEAFDAYWIPRGWSKNGPIKTESRIDVPSFGKAIPPGRTPIAGVAWGGIRSISKVEVRVVPSGAKDGAGTWMTARLGDALSQSTWRQWVTEWDAQPGDYEITVRATDGTGETQTSEVADPAPDGATGWHQVRVKVRAP